MIIVQIIEASDNKAAENSIKLGCDERFTHAFTAGGCVFKEITLVGSNQGTYFENVTACSKRTLKTTVATQLKTLEGIEINLGQKVILFTDCNNNQ